MIAVKPGRFECTNRTVLTVHRPQNTSLKNSWRKHAGWRYNHVSYITTRATSLITDPYPPRTARSTPLDGIGTALETHGYIIVEDALPPGLASGLLRRSRELDDGDFVRAGIGRENDHHVNRFVRGDWVYWPAPDEPGVAAYLEFMESLRLQLNRRLFLGLFDYECHFACYPVGARYLRHVDAFRGDTNRVLSTVLYLNPDWSVDDGGELLLYRGNDCDPFESVSPAFGTLVVFLSEEFPHEVLPALRPRYSLTGWFRVNGSVAGFVDPPR